MHNSVVPYGEIAVLQYPVCMKVLSFISVWGNNYIPFSLQPVCLPIRNAGFCDVIRSTADVGNLHFVI